MEAEPLVVDHGNFLSASEGEYSWAAAARMLDGDGQALALTPKRRARILERLQRHVAERVLPFIEADPQALKRRRVQIDQFSQRLTHLCAENVLSLHVEDGSVKVYAATGDAETTLALLRRGTRSFEGHDVEALVASAIFYLLARVAARRLCTLCAQAL